MRTTASQRSAMAASAESARRACRQRAKQGWPPLPKRWLPEGVCFSWEGRQRIHARRNLDGLRRTVNAFLFGGAERQEVLRTFDRILEPPEKLLQVVAALDEIDLRGVDYQEVRGGVAEKEMLVGARDLLDVFE